MYRNCLRSVLARPHVMRRYFVTPFSPVAFSLFFMSFAFMGCDAPAVGDPCSPESVPENGFVSSEVYLETSSVQCQTRVCMVYKLQGDTRKVGCNDTGCVSEQDIKDRVYCTCRCDGPPEATAKFCECPSGYTCEEVLQSDKSGPGVRGSYCVKKETAAK